MRITEAAFAPFVQVSALAAAEQSRSPSARPFWSPDAPFGCNILGRDRERDLHTVSKSLQLFLPRPPSSNCTVQLCTVAPVSWEHLLISDWEERREERRKKER